jgi:hypothetical protein
LGGLLLAASTPIALTKRSFEIARRDLRNKYVSADFRAQCFKEERSHFDMFRMLSLFSMFEAENEHFSRQKTHVSLHSQNLALSPTSSPKHFLFLTATCASLKNACLDRKGK